MIVSHARSQTAERGSIHIEAQTERVPSEEEVTMTGRDTYAWRIAWLVCLALVVGATTQAASTAIDFERRVEA